MKPKKIETNKLTKSANVVTTIYKDLHININSIKPVSTTTNKDHARYTNSVPSSNVATSKASSVVNKSKLKMTINKSLVRVRTRLMNSKIHLESSRSIIDQPQLIRML